LKEESAFKKPEQVKEDQPYSDILESEVIGSSDDMPGHSAKDVQELTDRGPELIKLETTELLERRGT